MSGFEKDVTLAADVRELRRLLPSVFRNLKAGIAPAVNEFFKCTFARPGLGNRHLPVLLALAFEGPSTVSELAELIALAPATTSMLVNELDRNGLVERAEDESDRRKTIVSLPGKHRQEIAAWAKECSEPLRRSLQRLEPTERAHFLKGMRILAEEAGARWSH